MLQAQPELQVMLSLKAEEVLISFNSATPHPPHGKDYFKQFSVNDDQVPF
jgi:hypothetical protein